MKILRALRTAILKNRQHWSSAAFAFGFLLDSLTLTRVDMLYDNLVLTFYLGVATLGILVFHSHEIGRLRLAILERCMPWIPFVIQFAFGGLFSGYIIFYSRSGTLIGNWPFLLFLIALFVGNERFRKHYQLLTFQVSILFIALFSYTIFSLPVLFKVLGTSIFLLSGFTSLLFTAGVLYALYRIAPVRFNEAKRTLLISIISIFLFFNVAYFTNIIPPIPLALKDLGIYHSVERVTDGYGVTYERPPWYRFFDVTSRTFHYDGGPLYAFSSVFAPNELTTTILHRWSYYDEIEKEWVVASKVPFPIAGGRDGGYRGYSLKAGVFPGRWRIEVVTTNNLLIGRRTFTIVSGETSKPLETAIR